MRIYIVLILAVVFSSCVRNKNGQAIQNTPMSNAQVTNAKVFEVKEVVQANNYSYLKVKENLVERWVAVKRAEIKAGEVYYYDEALEMTNFKSKDLDRTFDLVYFVNEISKEPFAQKKMDLNAMHKGKVNSGNAEISMKKSEGEITLGQIFENQTEYVKDEFEITGVVVKVTPQVMGKNWVHIQDGTAHKGSFDLTVTTESLPVVNDEVTFKGKLTLNKDFGAGYAYEVIMENAEMTNKKTPGQSL